jgi:sugar phosphate isomerase/epimerase
MSISKKSNSMHSRRAFLFQSSLASLGLFVASKSAIAENTLGVSSPTSLINGVQVGAITYSFRSLPGNATQILQYCIDANISAIELMGDAIEQYAGAPTSPVQWVPGMKIEWTDELKAKMKTYQTELVKWRESVSMDKFKEIKKMYNKAGVTIYAFKPNALNPTNTDGEIEYALKAAKALGAKSVTVEIPNDPKHSKRLGDLGEKHGIYIGYHAHLQATDTAWDIALSQSPFNSMNLDCGHYIAAGGANTKETLLALIKTKHDRITSMHIKDRLNKENGGENRPWGQGNTPIKEILTLLKENKYSIPATIELEYDIPVGSDAVKETRKCMEYAKNILA